MKEVKIYTDGACRGNPGPGGYGAVLQYGSHEKEISGSKDYATNNQMELMAAIVGLKILKESCNVQIYSDSKYLTDSFNKGWIYNWQRQNWMHGNGERANADLFKELLTLVEKHKVTFHWVKGHSGHPLNERCDKIANKAIDLLLAS